jgi:DNA repair exonuclease SbcCD ATPase subunit
MVRQSARLAAYERQQVEDARALGQLRAAVRPEQARNAAPPVSPSEAGPAASPSRLGAPDTSELAVRDAAIQQLNHELAEAHADIARLQTQPQNSVQEKQEALAAAGEDFQKREREWRDQLDSFKQQLDSARAESQAARERAASLEADNAKIKSEGGAGSTRAAELRKALATLQDLDRRRDAYLSSIIRRYREITDQFRAMTATLDSSHGAESIPFSGIALSRIQNAISLAEDDMRRLNELNAQARQIENKLAKN